MQMCVTWQEHCTAFTQPGLKYGVCVNETKSEKS